MTYEDVKRNGWLIYECLSGSKAYGLDLPSSDTDIKGIYVLPQRLYYGLDKPLQLSNESNDTVYYELERAVELLLKSNPTVLEMLFTPADKVLYRHPLMDRLDPARFLSKACKDTFAGYARGQIQKARGLNKKIVNPVEKERKAVPDFCYVPYRQGSVPVQKWLESRGLRQENCGLAAIPHITDGYGLYYSPVAGFYKGIVQKASSNDISLSSIPVGEEPLAVMFYNKDGYTKYCRDYKEYWDWVEKRNNERYDNNIAHGKNYDSKNLMHTFRLLDMAEDIAAHSTIRVTRPNREELLAIRRGEYEYDELIKMAGEKISRIEQLFENSTLPYAPDETYANEVLWEIRMGVYGY